MTRLNLFRQPALACDETSICSWIKGKDMAIVATSGKVHWNYFLALEHDLELASRYVEFSNDNMQTYSVEFAHLLLAASSEVDVVAKLLCLQLDPAAPCNNIDQYRQVFARKIPDIPAMQVFVPRYGLELIPWSNWASATSPDWWRSHNNVKHERNAFFQEATLKNALNAMAALLTLVFHYYSFTLPGDESPLHPKDTTQALQPQSSLMQLPSDHYYSVRIC